MRRCDALRAYSVEVYGSGKAGSAGDANAEANAAEEPASPPPLTSSGPTTDHDVD